MLSTLVLPLLLGMQAQQTAPPSEEPIFGLLTNEEQVYFEREAGRPAPPWLGIWVGRRDGVVVADRVDAFGVRLAPTSPLAGLQRTGPGRFSLILDGQHYDLRAARLFTCWVSVRRHADSASGEADWSFDRNLAIHDQGGRVLVQPEGAPEVVIRMRNVVWPPPSTNRPSLVLYVHRPESPDRAESYSWADPDARMVGINLRWMQASCTRV